MKQVSMQIGVDVLGFPIYRVHTEKKVAKDASKFFKSKTQEETIIEIKTIKQH